MNSSHSREGGNPVLHGLANCDTCRKARNLPPNRKAPGSDAEWNLLLREHPALVRRPVVVTDDGVVTQGFSDNGFKARFGK